MTPEENTELQIENIKSVVKDLSELIHVLEISVADSKERADKCEKALLKLIEHFSNHKHTDDGKAMVPIII